MEYENFDVLIHDLESGQYRTHVIESPSGQARGILSLSTSDMIAGFQSLRRLVLDPHGNTTTPSERLTHAQKLGELLYEVLMSGDVRTCFEVSRDRMRRENKGLRIRLRIDPPILAALPWELMRDRQQNYFLALSNQTPIVRYLELRQSTPPPDIQLPLNLLVVVASPTNQVPIDVAGTVAQIERGLADLVQQQLVSVTIAHNASLLSLQQLLRDGEYHALHFAGHGVYQADQDEGYLVFEDTNRDSVFVSGQKLGRLLHDEPTLRLVVLAACATSQGEQRPFASVASALIQAGIPAVLAMQAQISEEASLQFTRTFYESVAARLPIDTAVSEGRKAIDFSTTQSVEWATPQLYMLLRDGQLFQNTAKGKSQITHEAKVDAPSRPVAYTTPTQPTPLANPQPRIEVPSDIHTDTSMIAIPAGAFPYQDNQELTLPTFVIDRFPVTNDDYSRFVQATNCRPPTTWIRGRIPAGKERHPVVGVSFVEATAYATWAQKRLPTAAEWEKAARGTERRKYPWGNEFDRQRCNTRESNLRGTTPIDQYRLGTSMYGVTDLAGNVWEWTVDQVPSRGFNKPPKRILKGGSWNDTPNSAECKAQLTLAPDEHLEFVGFRCVR